MVKANRILTVLVGPKKNGNWRNWIKNSHRNTKTNSLAKGNPSPHIDKARKGIYMAGLKNLNLY